MPAAGRSPRIASHSSNCPLPSIPAMPRTSALWMVKVAPSTANLDLARRLTRHVEIRDPQHLLRAHLRVATRRVGQLGPDHELGKFAPIHLVRQNGGNCGAIADDRDLVRHLQHLVELVGDEDDRGSVGDELVKRDEQLVDLLRDEHRGRLVEDQHLGAAVQHLEDLDALSLPDPERGHECIEVDVAADRPRQLGEAVLGLAELQAHHGSAGSAPRMMFSTTVKLSASMKC